MKKYLKETTSYSAEDAKFMQMAIDLSVENVANGGGPFGAVIVRGGEVLATGTNRVTANNDPTAHAEVSAIREACAKIGDFKLEGATIYTSCEPCPMCLSAIYWAGISRIFYGNTKADAKAVNFGIVYGISAFALSDDLHVSMAQAKEYMEKYFEHYAGVRAYMSRVVEQGNHESLMAQKGFYYGLYQAQFDSVS